MAFNPTYRAHEDGLNNVLTINGGEPGPHTAFVESLTEGPAINGKPLGRYNWRDDEPLAVLLPGVFTKVRVTIDARLANPEYVELEAEPLDARPRSRKASKAPSVRVPATQQRSAVMEPADAIAVVDEDSPLLPDKPRFHKEIPEDTLRLEHQAAETPHEVTASSLLDAQPARPKGADPVTDEERRTEHERAADPGKVDRERLEAEAAEQEKATAKQRNADTRRAASARRSAPKEAEKERDAEPREATPEEAEKIEAERAEQEAGQGRIAAAEVGIKNDQYEVTEAKPGGEAKVHPRPETPTDEG